MIVWLGCLHAHFQLASPTILEQGRIQVDEQLRTHQDALLLVSPLRTLPRSSLSIYLDLVNPNITLQINPHRIVPVGPVPNIEPL